MIRDYTDAICEKIAISAGGQSIVDKINTYGEGEIQSIDSLCHGNEVSLLFKIDDEGNFQELYYTELE